MTRVGLWKREKESLWASRYVILLEASDGITNTREVLVSLQVRSDTASPLIPTQSLICRQDRIDHGVLIRWTKGFGAPNTEGQDVAAMFRKSLEKYVGRQRLSLNILIFTYLINLETSSCTRGAHKRYNWNAHCLQLR
jgi:hypothetical protein